MSTTVALRAEAPADLAGVRAVHLAAFPTRGEADLVNALREQARPIVSLVAERAGRIAGHILFSPVTLDGSAGLTIMGLAPVAVLPAFQGQGIGGALVRAGLEACRDLGAGAVVVLGHAAYYPKFGFAPASRLGLRSEYDVPDEVFMAVELRGGYLRGHTGTVRYHAAFAGL